MARQTKRIRKNIQTTQELEEELSEKPQERKYKSWEHFLLVGIICLTLFLLSAGWSYFNTVNKAMYSMLLVTLLLMYVQRRRSLSASAQVWIGRAVFATIVIALILFAYAVYLEHFA